MAKRKPNNYVIDEENGIAKIELRSKSGNNLWTIIDLVDLDGVIQYTWYIRGENIEKGRIYATHTIYSKDKKAASKTIDMQLFLMNPDQIEGIRVDHINNNTLDNRRCNLRIANIQKNAFNRSGRNKNNKSGHRNVCWDKKCGKWNVQLQIDGRNTVLAKFPEDQLEEAGKFAELMRSKYYGEFAGNG